MKNLTTAVQMWYICQRKDQSMFSFEQLFTPNLITFDIYSYSASTEVVYLSP